MDNPIVKIPEVVSALEEKPRNVLFILFDGLGIDAVERHLPADSFLRRHFIRPLSSVFPPTTTAATTTAERGLLPAAHSWLAWALYFPELKCNVELYRNTIHRSGGKPAAPYPVAETMMPRPDVYGPLKAAGITAGSISPFGSIPVTTETEVFETAAALCRQEGKHYFYCYWDDPDAQMHRTGVSSPQTQETIRRIDREVEGLCAALAGTDTLVIVTADHGLLNVRYRFLRDTPEVAAHLRLPMAMESRCPTFFVRTGREGTFARDFEAAYGEDFLLFTKEQVLERQLFGPGAEHPRFRDSFGDFLAVAVREVCLAPEPCRESETFVAGHGGLTGAEMRVPLFMVRC